ncbi:hypothetical protein FOL47_001047 [Perkinsus chesapeaki]|uniref:Alanine--tRNA ligase n=1 Tax=Perkinsus chesapeaki TaxID=330153 RepID=A0A7J6ML81_PERCH|nr:hypothetical protein FOL47_001047 [Perkinsus chesapeaki]
MPIDPRLSDPNVVRDAFINFFVEKKGATFIRSSPVVPHNDPTLLFINAGMNQFKPVFLGQLDKNHPFYGVKRATNTQKCIRAGGKHNDLDDVGKDTYHHTFFEMLGNWSFGDFFKAEQIPWAWELLTEVFGLDPARLYATYYGGDPKEPEVPADTEARDLWLKFLPPHHVIPFGMKENFWEMGDTGPCGPCSEIHYDNVGGRDASALVNMDDPTVIEIWNLVFMQYNRENDGTLTRLPHPCVDTGMGFERICAALTGKTSNYDTDVFKPIFAAIQEQIPGLRAYTGKLNDDIDIGYRVVADHIRTLTVALSDGAVPSNEGRGYVLRRILRRAVRYGTEKLNAPAGFFNKLVPAVVASLGEAFPEIAANQADVQALIADEEEQFARTLERGIREFNSRASKTEGKVLSGRDAFELFTTFGFPCDLTQVMAEERGMTVDVQGFEEEFEAFRQKSKESNNFTMGSNLQLFADQTNYLENELKVPKTDEACKYVWDSAKGEGTQWSSQLCAIWDGKHWLDSIDIKSGYGHKTVGLVLSVTPFYAEQGGQIFDVGTIVDPLTGARFDVQNTQKFGQYVLHIGTMDAAVDAALKVGSDVRATVDYQRRALIAKNHTATHILNFALRQVLGEKCDQRGSLVEPSRLRFDFAQSKPISNEQLKEVEQICNQQIQKHLEVFARDVQLAKAQDIKGLRAVFGETYPDPVRVVSVGEQIDTLLTDSETDFGHHFSIEFCGGTHVGNSQEIFKFVITAEEGIAKGIRRIVAATGPQAAVEASIKTTDLMEELNSAKGLKGQVLDHAIAQLRNKLNEEKEVSLTAKKDMLCLLDDLKTQQIKEEKKRAKEVQKQAAKIGEELADSPEAVNGKFLVTQCDELLADAKALQNAVDAVSKKLPELPVCLISASSSKVAVLITVPKSMSKKASAKEWLNACLEACGGKGGGSPVKAQGQSQEPSKVSETVEAAKEWASKHVE